MLCVFLLTATGVMAEPVNFERQIKPIFQARCQECHGDADSQEGGLRLTHRRAALRRIDSGVFAIVPGRPAASTLWQRIVSQDPELRMPPEGAPLSEQDAALIARWIKEGATWPETSSSGHWAYQPPRAIIPPADRSGWSRTAIDRFVLARMKAAGMNPTVTSEPARLLRRVYLDLIGLPPTIDEVNKFLRDPSDEAYAEVVERLLASPRYGEKWARHWLDLARYSDSNGYQADQIREMWAFRDWVIDAMNCDMPFDQFTIEQLAGDLLPQATLSQQIATGFHRATTCNVEAGVDPEGNRTDQVIDRINTTGTTWLATTLECAQCHNHKYDPISQEEYYELFAFFNNTPLEVKQEKAGSVQFNFYGPKIPLPVSYRKRTEFEAWQEQATQIAAELKQEKSLALAELPNWLASKRESENLDADLPANIGQLLRIDPAKLTKPQSQQLQNHFLSTHPRLKQLRQRQAEIQQQLAAAEPPTTLVMQELPEPRQTNMFLRGNFLDPGPQVFADVPRVLNRFPDHAPRNRLGFAQWLVDPNNPLTARVAVNRWWQEFFGQGIVRTIEDFGTQGDAPTHPELLDWLAIELQRSGWSMKHIHRLIVTSSTYRQSARVPTEPKSYAADPDNTWLARGPRCRLPAELIRDNTLAISGLMSDEMGGPPVYPPQPAGLWNQTGRNEPVFETDEDPDRFRRGIYVVWRRAAPYPSFVNFDAPDRMTCVAKRAKTNTPLQALTLLNDQAYVEMALAMAARVVKETPGRSLASKIEYAMRLALARYPRRQEVTLLEDLLREELDRLAEDQAAVDRILSASALLAVSQPDEKTECAAWFCVCNAILNLDETISK